MIDSFLNDTLFFPCSFTFPFLFCSSVYLSKKEQKTKQLRSKKQNNKNKTKLHYENDTLIQGTTPLLQFLISYFWLALQLH